MTLAIIQARLSSLRLPGKALLPIAGQPLLAHVVARTKAIQQVDAIVLALPAGDPDQPLFAWATRQRRHLGICRPPRVDPNDVLGRLAHVVARYDEADRIVRITGDCPLLAPELANPVLATYRAQGVEYASNIGPGYVDGTDIEVVSRDALLWAHRQARNPADREHVTTWIKRHVMAATITTEGNHSWLKVSVDTQKDLARVRRIADQLPVGDFSFTTLLRTATRCLRAA